MTDTPAVNPFGDDAAKDETKDAASVEAPAKESKPKAPRKRRTKAEIEADNAKTAGSEEVDFTQLDFESLPLSAVSGNVVGSVSLNQGSVPTLSIALQGWIGEPPIFLAAAQIGDVEEVLRELKKQAKDATRKS